MALDPPPTISPIALPQRGNLTADWTRWFLALWGQVIAQPSIQGTSISLANQNTSIGVTAFPLPSIAGGFYRISGYVHITTLAGVSGSVSVTLSWTENGVPRSKTVLSITQPTPSLSGTIAETIVADQGTPIAYATAYASNPAGDMHYFLGLVVEQLGS